MVVPHARFLQTVVVAAVLLDGYIHVSNVSGLPVLDPHVLPFANPLSAFASATSLLVVLLLALPGPLVVALPEAAEPSSASGTPRDPRALS
jgi:hypothetical protein